MDNRLEAIIGEDGEHAAKAASLRGKVAIANAKLAYKLFADVIEGERFEALARAGATMQRPLWASTSTKNPDYPETLYVDELIGPHTVNTVPPHTLDAFNAHGAVAETLTQGVTEAQQVMDDLAAVGISIDEVTNELEINGVRAFSDSFAELLATVEARRQSA